MLKPRAPRLVAGLLVALVLPTLAACRTSPDVAAYVGDSRVTVAELERAVDERLADDDVAAYAAGNEAAFTRRVLAFLVEQEVYAEVVERYDAAITDAAVRDRIEELLGGQDPDLAFTELARQGVSRTDVEETVRRQLVREAVAEAEGLGDLDQETLQQVYEEVREQYAQLEFGYIAVPDEATAAAVLGELTAAPDSYAAVAARYPGEATLPELTRRSVQQLPPALRPQLAAAAPGTGFTVPVEGLGTVVGFVTGRVYPSIEELRDEVQAAAVERLDAAGAELVAEVRADIDITVNPRYGVLDESGRLVPDQGGVVRILGGPDDGAGSTAGD